VIRYYKVRT